MTHAADDLKDLKQQVEAGTFDAPTVLNGVRQRLAPDNKPRAAGILGVMLGHLAKRQDAALFDQALGLLVSLHAGDRAYKSTLLKLLQVTTEAWPEVRHMLDLVGFDKPLLRPVDCYARLHFLLSLAPGSLVYDKSLGVGEVREVQLADSKVEIDFAQRPGHRMALSFAAEALQLLPADHLLARRHRDPEAFERMLSEQPGEAIKSALRSFGPKSAPLLQDLFVPRLLPEARWKSFWEAARRALKNDPLVVIPTKRNEPLQLLDKQKSYDEAWFAALAKERQIDRIVASLDEYLAAHPQPTIDASARETVLARLNFAVKGASARDHDLPVKCLLLAQSFGLAPEEIGLASFLERLFELGTFKAQMERLGAREVKGLLDYLPKIDAERAHAVLLAALPDLGYTALTEAIALLLAGGKEAELAAAIRRPWSVWEAEVDLMYWLATHPERLVEWRLGGMSDLTNRLFKVVHNDYGGDRLRMKNQIKDLFRDPDWLRQVLGGMDGRQQRVFTQAAKDATSWEKLDQNSVLGQIVKIVPEMREIVSGRGESKESKRGPMTSIRSYTERAVALKKLVEKDIPENSREIAHARSYGDLRENFEYKAAKDMQRVLMQRKAEMENALRQVTPTNFEGLPTDRAGMGTTVRLREESGAETVYHILGEWDGDTAQNIISSGSALAKALYGKTAGQPVSVPDVAGERTVTLVEVGPLPEAVRAYATEEIRPAPAAPAGADQPADPAAS
jgi:transcription elongation GreA/GreB family factor